MLICNYLIMCVTGQKRSGPASRPHEEKLRKSERSLAVLGKVGNVLAVGTVLLRYLEHCHLSEALLTENSFIGSINNIVKMYVFCSTSYLRDLCDLQIV